MPQPPGEVAPFSFPLIATVAPMIGSVAIWAITHSPFALVFALLGPIVAIGSLTDSRVHGRRRRKRERRRFDGEMEDIQGSVTDRHNAERERRRAAFPSVRDILTMSTADSRRWNSSLTAGGPGVVPVPIGIGDEPSTLEISAVVSHSDDREVVARLEQFRAMSTILTDARLVIDGAVGIGVCGQPAAASAAARACALQLARFASPAAFEIRVEGMSPGDREWLVTLPHRPSADRRKGPEADGDPAIGTVEFVPIRRTAREPPDLLFLVLAQTPAELPRRCTIVIEVQRNGTAQVTDRRDGTIKAVKLDYASREEAIRYCAILRSGAMAEGLGRETAILPERVSLRTLLPKTGDGVPEWSRHSLRAVIGMTADSPLFVDLVGEGPHAVIGGTTGSGKSELLVSWILALAARHPPECVTFLLVDFKGGASFGPIRTLPHCVGLITDLDGAASLRALESLRAEVLYRERMLALAGARELAALPSDVALARLVIVVDEFAVLAREHPELRELFADLAARGRSLGVHLVLCTQRPAESLRDNILANCTLRLSLRVNSAADSVAVIGTNQAVELPRQPGGRALISVAGETPRAVQVALADEDDAASVLRVWADRVVPSVRRPWCDPLPERLPASELRSVDTGLVFARADRPEEQRQEDVSWLPERDGNLAVLGARGAGKSTLIAVLATGQRETTPVLHLPQHVEGAWDAVSETLARLGSSRRRGEIIAIDDVDLLVSKFGTDHQLEFVDMLGRLMREGPHVGVFTVVTAQRVPSLLSAVLGLCDARLLLRLPTRQDHVLAGGATECFDPGLPAGGGFWRESRVQVGLAAPIEHALWPPPSPLRLDPSRPTAIVTRSPREAAARFSAVDALVLELDAVASRAEPFTTAARSTESSAPTVIIGDPESWQAAWSFLAAARRTVTIVFHGCSPVEFRSVTGQRQLPPPLGIGADRAWRLSSDGAVDRVTLPPARR